MPRVAKQKDRSYFLPGSLTTVYQSNRITNGHFQGFGLLHTKIFVAVIKALQEAILAEINGVDWKQLQLFKECNSDNIVIQIMLAEIATPQHYLEVINAVKDLMQLTIKLRAANKKGKDKDYISFRSLFTGVDTPSKFNGKKMMAIHMLKDVANEIVLLDKNHSGKGSNFTKFFYETVMSTSSKYTARLYMIVASWKMEGAFYISLEDLRQRLDIDPTQYKNYADFKRRVLVPAEKELFGKADCWFKIAEKGFEHKLGKKTIGLSFKVISKKSEEREKDLKDYIRNLLKMHCSFTEKQLHRLKPIFDNAAAYQNIMIKIEELSRKKVDENGARIKNKQAYMIAALLGEFL
jgi:Initiator Replication protein